MTAALRVALTCNNYPPEFLGGTERVVRALARGLRAAGDDIIVISGSEQPHDGRDVIREDDDGIEVFRVPRLAGEPYGVTIARPRVTECIVGILGHEAIDVLHVNHWSHLCDDQVRAARAQLGIPAVATLHDLWATCPRFFRLPPDGIVCPDGRDRMACIDCANRDLNESRADVAAKLEARDDAIARELGAARAIVVPSEASKRACACHLRARAADELQVVPHGLLDAAGVPVRGPLGLPFRVGTFGNLNREKGVLDLIAAMAGLRAELHLFGAAQDGFGTVASSAAERAGVRATWHGAYGAADRHPALGMDLAVFPSLCRESYGLVVDEALHHGTPVVVSDIGALPERIARGGGLAVPPGDAATLAGTIRRLVEDREAYDSLRASIPTSFPTVADAVERYRHLYAKAWAVTESPR